MGVYLCLSCVWWVETVFKCVNIVYLFTQKHTAFCFPGGFYVCSALGVHCELPTKKNMQDILSHHFSCKYCSATKQ